MRIADTIPDRFRPSGGTTRHGVNRKDVALLTEYMSGELPPEDVLLVQDRLDNDPDFLSLALPLMLAWKMTQERAQLPEDEEIHLSAVERFRIAAAQKVTTRNWRNVMLWTFRHWVAVKTVITIIAVLIVIGLMYLWVGDHWAGRAPSNLSGTYLEQVGESEARTE